MADATLARARLSIMVAATSRPTITPEELDLLMDAHRIPDDDGRLPSDPGWTPTWDLNRAAAEGWRWKAGRVAGDFNFSADDASYSKGDVMARCESQARYYESFGITVLGVRDDHATAPYDSPRLAL